MLHVTDAKYINEFLIWLSFDDGSKGIVDLNNRLKGPVFEPLNNKDFFKQVELSEELGTITWPNGVDLAPEFLRDLLIKADGNNY